MVRDFYLERWNFRKGRVPLEMWGGSGSNAEKNTLLILIVVGEVNFFRGLTKIKDLQGLFDT